MHGTTDGDGVLHFADSIAEAAAVNLAYQGRRLVLPFTAGGQRVASIDWSLTFAVPADLVLAGAGAGAAGPSLTIRVDSRDPTRLIYAVSGGPRPLQAVLEREDARSFHVVSRGATGQAGASGSSGFDGSSGSGGSSASCPSFSGPDGSRGRRIGGWRRRPWRIRRRWRRHPGFASGRRRRA